MPQQMAYDTGTLSAVDVYDIAASIGKEFEKVIDHYGPESVAELMPKIITVLEHLETLSNTNQKENAQITELNYTIERLQADRKARAVEREKFDQELEQIEESWRKETEELALKVTRLEENNQRLNLQLRDHPAQPTQNDEQEALLLRLQGEVREMREKLHDRQEHNRSLNREITQRNTDLDALQSQVDRLTKLNSDVRSKMALSQRRMQDLIQDKADLQAQLHDKDQQLGRIRDNLQELSERQLQQSGPAMQASVTEEDLMSIEDRLQREGKLIIDLSDPNRPRYTLSELREVLTEKNELKAKLMDVEEELKQYKPPPPEPVGYDAGDYDLPVQGPINKEPDEKLYPERYKESGIRRFFKYILSPGKSRRSSMASSGKNSPNISKKFPANGTKSPAVTNRKPSRSNITQPEITPSEMS